MKKEKRINAGVKALENAEYEAGIKVAREKLHLEEVKRRLRDARLFVNRAELELKEINEALNYARANV